MEVSVDWGSHSWVLIGGIPSDPELPEALNSGLKYSIQYMA